MTTSPYQFIDCSMYKNVYAVGDIHGEYNKLVSALLKVGFMSKTDLLISVGDLVDRGPQSEDFETFIRQEWVRRVLGNHDDLPREYLLGYESEVMVKRNGGQWFLDKSKDEQERIATLLGDAPLAIEILTPGGRRVGFTHADMGGTWDTLKESLSNPQKTRYMIDLLTGSREMIKVVRGESSILCLGDVPVEGIDHVFHGHTPVDEILTYANRTWIDTGACMGGHLSIIDVDEWIAALPK